MRKQCSRYWLCAILYRGRGTRRDRGICTIRTKCCARETTQPNNLIMFRLRCTKRSATGKYVQSVHNARSVQIVHIMRAALIGKYAAPWSGGQFSLQGHLPTKHCSNATEMQIQNGENTNICTKKRSSKRESRKANMWPSTPSLFIALHPSLTWWAAQSHVPSWGLYNNEKS